MPHHHHENEGNDVLSGEDLCQLLSTTSRTFALAIPLLGEPLARHVGLAYLLFRIADELEDAPLWRRDRRVRALVSVSRWLAHAAEEAHGEEDDDGGVGQGEEWQRLVSDEPPTTHDGCLELLARSNDVLSATKAIDAPLVQSVILGHTRRTAIGMADFVARQDEHGGLILPDVERLRSYCYVVAGIVGELLTDLFALSDPNLATLDVRTKLDRDARSFGEGLQLVNILKDASADESQGRVYLPRNTPRSDIVDLARANLACAARYVHTLTEAKAAPGVIAFCDLPLRLAEATLDALERGAPKLTREAVMRIFASVAKPN